MGSAINNCPAKLSISEPRDSDNNAVLPASIILVLQRPRDSVARTAVPLAFVSTHVILSSRVLPFVIFFTRLCSPSSRCRFFYTYDRRRPTLNFFIESSSRLMETRPPVDRSVSPCSPCTLLVTPPPNTVSTEPLIFSYSQVAPWDIENPKRPKIKLCSTR